MYERRIKLAGIVAMAAVAGISILAIIDNPYHNYSSQIVTGDLVVSETVCSFNRGKSELTVLVQNKSGETVQYIRIRVNQGDREPVAYDLNLDPPLPPAESGWFTIDTTSYIMSADQTSDIAVEIGRHM